jgi:hypothetical protein
MSIIVETRSGGRVSKAELALGESELADAVGRLDGHNTTAVTVGAFGNELLIGGGDEGNYIVTVFRDGMPFSLVGDRQAGGVRMMVIGGQLIPQPEQYLVGPERALAVARYFARTGQLDQSESWDE